MSQKIHYASIILSENIYAEVELLQKKLSDKDNKIWSFSNTVNLLLRYSFHEENCFVYAQNHSFLDDYLVGKESFLKDFSTNVLRSMIDDKYCNCYN